MIKSKNKNKSQGKRMTLKASTVHLNSILRVLKHSTKPLPKQKIALLSGIFPNYVPDALFWLTQHSLIRKQRIRYVDCYSLNNQGENNENDKTVKTRD